MTAYILLVIAIAVIAYILVTDHRRLPAVEAERNRLAAELDLWTTTGMQYWRDYPRFDWPPAWPGHSHARSLRELDPNGTRRCRHCDKLWADCDCPTWVLEAGTANDYSDWVSEFGGALIVDDVYVHPHGSERTIGFCANCDSPLRMCEESGSICSACSEHAQRWYSKPLDQGFGRLPHPTMNPHVAWIRYPIYDDRDGISGSSCFDMAYPEYLEWASQEDPSTSDLHAEYVPPEQGPREGSRSPAFRSDFVPIPGDDDIPF
jgi:hypothetical protein